ncbi:MAG: T9SS type A sorting domain-containing protein [Bacteroidales bacterium]|jgi:uncharacterized protein (TIGR02145 family)|nr:T9SS type A sorting domain-containing protein [Bacteroidales bacterium]
MKLKIFSFVILLFVSVDILKAQDYLISFAGSGASTTVDSVIVENLTQGTYLGMSGNNVLHLVNTLTGVEQVNKNSDRKITFYPNPMEDFTLMKFVLPEDGTAVINMYDISGRKILQTQEYLSEGQHTYRIQVVGNGLYVVTIRSGGYSLSGKFLSTASQPGIAKMVYENTTLTQEKSDISKIQEDAFHSKGMSSDTSMQYTDGDRLKFTGSSGIYSTVMTDIPLSDTINTFNFIACTDGDGNNYPVVEISTQVWMAKNIKATKYTDGTSIPFINTDSLWSKLTATDTAYCYYNNDVNNADLYGALYTWAAAMNGAASSAASPSGIQGICPIGWHLPSDAEWTILTTFLNGESSAGGKLKETGTEHWNTPNTGATNETGFTALAGGQHAPGIPSTSMGTNGFWLSSTENFKDYVWFRWLSNSAINVYRSSDMTSFGRSVRCVKDN